jgi:hypothetical protein
MIIKIKKDVAQCIFYFVSVTLILFLLSEIIWPNSVLSYININYIVVLWVISWLLLL